MADLLRIRADTDKSDSIVWNFTDENMTSRRIVLDQPPVMKIQEGDIWQVELVGTKTVGRKKTATVRLVAKVQELRAWQKVKELPRFWMEPDDLQSVLTWLHTGTDVILIGPKGTGKTTLGFKIAEALGWQEPCKVDVYTARRTTDLFGTDAARDKTSLFIRSAFLDYIERARTAHREGLDTHFLGILDEINRVHAKSNEPLHGLFDDTRQITIITAEGSKIVRLPPNLHVIGTMNMGAEYLGVFNLDEALKDRFAPLRMKQMPEDYEVKMLTEEEEILEAQALQIVRIARVLRDAAGSSQISYSPSYRACRNVARLVKYSMDLRTAVIKGFLGWYEGELKINERGEVADPNTEVAKAFSALRMKGTKDIDRAHRAVSDALSKAK